MPETLDTEDTSASRHQGLSDTLVALVKDAAAAHYSPRCTNEMVLFGGPFNMEAWDTECKFTSNKPIAKPQSIMQKQSLADERKIPSAF